MYDIQTDITSLQNAVANATAGQTDSIVVTGLAALSVVGAPAAVVGAGETASYTETINQAQQQINNLNGWVAWDQNGGYGYQP